MSSDDRDEFPPTILPAAAPEAPATAGDLAPKRPPLPRPQAEAPDTVPPGPGGQASASPPGPLADAPDSARVPGYEILGTLGRGGMGVVYKARQEKLNRVVALKMILHAGHAAEDDRLRFLREAEAIAAIKHHGVVQVHDYGTHEGAPYFALEYCEGGSLAKKLSGKPLPPREAADLVAQVAEAVQAAHDAGIVHRDLKPGNVLLSAARAAHGGDGSTASLHAGGSTAALPAVREAAKVTDFGLARRLEGGSGMTQTDQVMGTPSYMAPEQARATREAGTPADVYGLGAILYECLTGRPPFAAASALDTLAQVLHDEPPAPRSLNKAVPRDLETVALKCLHKSPEKRYASAQELADDLRRWLNDEPILARPAGPIERAVKWARRRPGAAAGLMGAIVGVAAVLVLAVVATYQWQEADVQRRKAETALTKRDEAESKRALALIDALTEAAPGAVPNILKGLSENEAVLPEVRRRYAQEKDEAKKTRLALALVDEQSVREGVLAFALKVDDPAEAVMLRDVLKPYGREMAAGLWAKVDADDGRFRALVALAAFDAGNERWKKESPALVEELLGANPLRLGAWVHALEPVSAALYEPLGKVFRDDRKERAAKREAAAEALALYLKARPDAATLFELLLDADGRQHALLSPLLAAHRDAAIGRMKAEMAKTVDRWKDGPLDAKWATVDDAMRGEIEKAGGIVAERWALCQMLPMERMEAVTQAMGKAGYRPTSVRPFAGSSLAVSRPGGEDAKPQAERLRTLVALVWTRDGRDWKLTQDLTSATLKDADAAQQKAGLIAADVASYAMADGVRHVALWRRGEADEKAVMYAGVPASKHKAETDVFKADGFVPARVQALAVGDATRYAGVWWKGKDKVENWNLRWANDEGLYSGHVADGDGLLLDVSPTQAAPAAAPRTAWLADLRKAEADALKQPADANPLYFQGVALYRLGRDGEALEAFGEYHKKSKLFWGHRYTALLHARAGDGKQAKEDLAAFAKINTDKALMPALTALVAVYLDESDEAVDEALKTLDADAKDSAVAYNAAGVYSRAAERLARKRTAWAAGLVGMPVPWALALQPSAARQQKFADRAVELLRLAAERGHDVAAMTTDADLEAIRTHPGYAKILADAGLTRHYASVWRNDSKTQAEGVQGLSAEAHLAKCRDLAAAGYRPVSLSLLAGEKVPLAASVWHRPVALAEREALAKSQGTAAGYLLALDEPEQVWPLLKHTPDPTLRSWVTWRAGERGSDPKWVIDRLMVEKDVSVKRALIVALGEYDGKRLPVEKREPLVETLKSWYRNDPDPGVHSAIGWLLRHKDEGPVPRVLDWKQAKALGDVDEELKGKPAKLVPPLPLAVSRPDSGAGWYVNGQGQTMVMLRGPMEFRMGSPLWEADRVAVNERPHVRRIERNYAIASTSVTLEQWGRFLKERPNVKHSYIKRYSPEAAGPAISVTWYDAAQYCNWLSDKEGIPPEQWCYPKEIGPGMKMYPDYLRRTGYRIPSEAEMEYACRAGSEESRNYGSVESLLGRYAIYRDNNVKDRTWPVGQKRPNDFGLFDGHGNVWNWCNEVARVYQPRSRSTFVQDLDDTAIVDASTSRALRGGSFGIVAPYVRSSYRISERPDFRYNGFGLRVCRTYH